MEVSALKYQAGVGRYGRSPLLRLQSDDHLIRLIRAGHDAAFETLVSRYEVRLLAFCRHLLGSREDAEDVLQDALSAAYNAILSDERPINVRPWLYRIARNRCLNHLRRIQAIGVDSMDVLYAENGETTADKVHRREEFRLLVDDIHELPETQRTALILREMDALSYEQIAEAMETTVSSVKSLLVRARVSLAEASEARLLSCEAVRNELASVAEGLIKRPGTLERRHLKTCERCSAFNKQLRRTNRALGALLPVGPLALLKTGWFSHVTGGHSAAAASSSAAGAATSGSAGISAAGVGVSTAAIGTAATSTTGFIGAGIGALATKAVAGLAAAALVTAGAVVTSGSHHPAVNPKLLKSAAAGSAKRHGASASRSHGSAPETATAVGTSASRLRATHLNASGQTKLISTTGLHGSASAASGAISSSGPSDTAGTVPAGTETPAKATSTPASASPGSADTLTGPDNTPIVGAGGASGTDGSKNYSLTTAAATVVGALPGSSTTASTTPTPNVLGLPTSGGTVTTPSSLSTTGKTGSASTKVAAAVSTVTNASATPRS